MRTNAKLNPNLNLNLGLLINPNPNHNGKVLEKKSLWVGKLKEVSKWAKQVRRLLLTLLEILKYEILRS